MDTPLYAEVTPDMRTRPLLAALMGVPLLAAGLLPAPTVAAQAPVRVILDGRTLSLDPAPTIVDGRTLVPLRGVFEAMGAAAHWNGTDQTVTVTKGDRYVRLKINRRLACMSTDCQRAGTLDVPAQLISDRTYVPIRFISNAMGVLVRWDNDRRTVIIETDQRPHAQPTDVAITTPVHGYRITGPIPLQAASVSGSIQYYLIDPATGAGLMIGAGPDSRATYTYTPDPTHAGQRLLVAAVKDSSGVTRYSEPISVVVAPDTKVEVTGADAGGTVDGPFTFGNQVNFVATHVVMDLIDPATGARETLGTTGPGDKITWYPQVGHNGPKQFQAIAYDREGKEYRSEPVPVSVNVGHRFFLNGVEEGKVLTRSTTLQVPTNFPVESIKYVANGKVLGWGYSYTWNVGPKDNGAYRIHAEILGKDGVTRSTPPVTVTVNAKPEVWVSGLGPKQVVTGAVTLKANSNVPLSSVKYYLTDGTVLGHRAPGEELTWTPTAALAGNRTLRAEARDTSGNLLYSDEVSFRVYLGKVYGPQPVVPKAEFKEFASRMAVPAYQDTGMSAALQVAQAILETGWGQSHPVDKYTGQVSNNLFGIKGTGTAGSVISNTWEEYNGVVYRIDDYFRAYNSVQESWRDHKDFLLTRERYAPVRAVMTNPVQGAWALKRAGYATDSRYPIKLIDIMKANDLFKLDQIEL